LKRLRIETATGIAHIVTGEIETRLVRDVATRMKTDRWRAHSACMLLAVFEELPRDAKPSVCRIYREQPKFPGVVDPGDRMRRRRHERDRADRRSVGLGRVDEFTRA
jgi:hypothetical protein